MVLWGWPLNVAATTMLVYVTIAIILRVALVHFFLRLNRFLTVIVDSFILIRIVLLGFLVGWLGGLGFGEFFVSG